MKKILKSLAVFAMTALVFAACGPDNPTPTPPTPGPGTGNENTGGETKELKADFTFEVDALTVQFKDASEGATAYLWNFGDENTSTEASPEHTYDAAGTYTVKLTVQDAAGNSKSVEKEVSVAGAVKAYFTATAQTDRAGKFGKIFTLDATASENAASIVWDFGDGSEASTEFSVNHEFPEFDKTYTVKATVTGVGGDTDVFEETVEVIGYNELLKGGSMEEDDATFWTVKEYFMMAEDWSGETTDPQFVHEFGHTATVPAGGKGGCLRLGGESQFMQYSFKSTVYQEIEVVEGDRIEISAQVKWGENTVDNGLMWWCIGQDAEVLGEDNSESTILELFNYWAVGVTDTPLPAWDGNLLGTGLPEGCGYGAASTTEITEDGKVIWTATFTGKAYFGFQLRSVWGNFWGEGVDYFIDEVSAKIVL
ncbi:MAG: PKD domain-containing protein [Bacteroidales bacterium]|nr:PKD domain-containing protein [Bacteroidales bacterium]MBQ8855793.1 PKD domain-containing protein [Bacteroidales bacterium]MBQ9723361.1 PKD domain-containing protein [Bacteroidales bacterium]